MYVGKKHSNQDRGGGVSANLPQVLESRILPVPTNKHPK